MRCGMNFLDYGKGLLMPHTKKLLNKQNNHSPFNVNKNKLIYMSTETRILIRDCVENIMRDLNRYFPHLNSNGVGRVEEKIEYQLKEFADALLTQLSLNK